MTTSRIGGASRSKPRCERWWRSAVNLLTAVEGKQKLFRFDGKEQGEKSIGN